VTRSKKRILILLLVLVLAAILLSGCGGVDPETGAYKPGIFEPLAAPLRALIVFFHDKLLVPLFGEPNSWGWSIILVALLIRLLLLPLGIKQMRSMKEAQAKMKILQPELDKIKKKYAHDKKKQQEAQMKLQQDAGIMKAQMAGCLPTLLQMPILFAFYYALIGLAAQGRIDNAAWYFIPDISKPEYRQGMSWLTQDFTLQKLMQPDIWPYLVLPALLAITQFAMTKYTQQAQPKQDDSNPAAGMMGSMTWIMTLMFVWFALQVPAGLSLYWVVSNSFALAQQLYVNRQAHKWENQLELDGVKAAASKSASADVEDAEFKDADSKPSAPPAKSTPAKRKRRRKR
jgi:YidC/Oxa1 family membrane protein insertase